jgi:hypothetical protein
MSTLSAFVIAVTVPLAIGLLTRAARPTARTLAGQSFIEYGWGLKGMAVFFSAVALGVVVLAFIVPKDKLWVLLTALIFALPAAYLGLEAFLVRVVFSDRGIETFSPWRKNRIIAWGDVVGVSYSDAAKWHLIKTRRQGHVRLHQMMSGVPSILAELRRRGVNGA